MSAPWGRARAPPRLALPAHPPPPPPSATNANSDCSGASVNVAVSQISGVCMADGAMSYSVGSCVNSTAININYFASSTTCSGSPNATIQNSVGTGLCTDGSITTCVSGTYTPVTSGFTINSYSSTTCPATGALTQQIVTPAGVCINSNTLPGGALSAQFSCNSTFAVATACEYWWGD